jgi:GTP-binding protein
MFTDEVSIQVTSGHGGDGIVHFRHEKYVPFGGPDGGNGGRGGDVILEVLPTLNTLSSFQHQKEHKAEDGRRGGGKDQTGRSGRDLILPVPPGTIVFDADTGELLGDLVEAGQRLVVARGGRGGRGNARFATARNQAPRLAEKGEPAQETRLRLELRLIADIGIVGVPNAGKSTFLAAVTRARPKIDSYPFTTLEPNLGVALLDEEKTLILADIPGLIEGAHRGIGLGHEFLRHIRRTRVLIHLLDGLSEDPVLDFAQINSELAFFDPELGSKPQVVALNKIDLPEVESRWPEIERQLKGLGGAKSVPPMGISALAGTNVRKVLYRAARLLEVTPIPAGSVGVPVYRLENDPQHFSVAHQPGGWRVQGEAIERAAAMTYWENDQSIRRFQRILASVGVEDALRQAGIKQGETVFIGPYELEWKD